MRNVVKPLQSSIGRKGFSGYALRVPETPFRLPPEQPRTSPALRVDAIAWRESGREVQFVTTGQAAAWLVASMNWTGYDVGIVERIATLVVVEALDDDGIPLASWRLDGETMLDGGVISHPTPARGVLRLLWRLQGVTASGGDRERTTDAASPYLLDGSDAIPPWDYDAFGWRSRFVDDMQIVFPRAELARLWLQASGQAAAWRISARGRLGGYAQKDPHAQRAASCRS